MLFLCIEYCKCIKSLAIFQSRCFEEKILAYKLVNIEMFTILKLIICTPIQAKYFQITVILRYFKKIEVLYFSSYFIFCCRLFLEKWSISSFRFLPLSLYSDIWYQVVFILSNLNPNHSTVVFPDPILQELEYYLNLKIRQLKLYL